MLRRAVFLFTCLGLGGCAQLLEALDRVSDEFDDAPAFFVARTTANSQTGQTAYVIERINITENRQGRPNGVRFEALRETVTRIEATSPGNFTQLDLRQDGQVLAAVAREDLGAQFEYYPRLVQADTGRVILGGTDNALVAAYTDACPVLGPSETIASTTAEFLTRGIASDDIRSSWAVSPNDIGESPVRFDGWSSSGDAVFTITLLVSGQIEAQTGDITGFEEFSDLFAPQSVTLSTLSGDIVTCGAQALDPATRPGAYGVVLLNSPAQDRAQFDVIAPDGSRDVLYRFPALDPPARLVIAGDVLSTSPAR